MTIKMQLEQEIISEVSTDAIHNNPEISFLAHNAVFIDQNSLTNCRVVFLSNICEKSNKNNLSHNQVLMPGNKLNNKLQKTALLDRFNKYLFIYDLEKAFVQM